MRGGSVSGIVMERKRWILPQALLSLDHFLGLDETLATGQTFWPSGGGIAAWRPFRLGVRGSRPAG